MEKKSVAAKTVAFSPLRQANTVFRNILDVPFRLKWPDIALDKITLIIEELKTSLTAVKRTRSRDQSRTSFTRPSKKSRLEVKVALSREGSCFSAPLSGSTLTLEPGSIEEQPFDSEKCSQIVVGINAVTRHLEKGALRAGVVCLSAKPAILQHHLLMLAATRDIPFVALPAFSETIAPRLGIKSVLALGFKKVEGEMDYFKFVVKVISDVAPPIRIPWLCLKDSGAEMTSQKAAGTKSSPLLASPAQAHTVILMAHQTESATPNPNGQKEEPPALTHDTPGIPYQSVKVKKTVSKPKIKK